MLIIDMPMPKNCHECEARCVSALYGRICGMTRKNIMPFLDKPNRPDWCPIKGELPDEHGDLIDRDELLKECYPDDEFDAHVIYADDIHKAKAIIAAERKDDEQIH